MKNASKNKFLTCFRPVIDLDDMLESETVPAPSTSRRKHATQNSATNSMSPDQNSPKSIQNQVAGHPPKQTLSKVIKAVVFQIILVSLLNEHCFAIFVLYKFQFIFLLDKKISV